MALFDYICITIITNTNYIMKKLSANIRNNFWVLNAKPISMIIGGMLVILYISSAALQLIEKLF